MITDDEVMRMLEQANPASVDDPIAMLDIAGYRDVLDAKNTTTTLINTEGTSIPPDSRPRWLSIAAAAATVAVIAGGLVLAARDDNETGGAADQVSPTDRTVSRVGFIGLPPEGATPSAPPVPVVSIFPCYAPIGDPSEIDTLPPLGALWVLDTGGDERLIWQKFEDLPEGANSRSTGLLEQRLTPEGVELMYAEAIAAFSSGEISDEDCDANRGYFVTTELLGDASNDDPNAGFISADNEHLARIMDPWSWLPTSAWEDPEISAYVPYEYLVAFEVVGESVDAWNNQPLVDGFPAGDTHLSAALPAAAAHLIDIRSWECGGGGYHVVCSATFHIDDARALAAALDEAGLEQDELLNAYRLDYEFEYPDETLDVPMHIWISANPPNCGLSMGVESCPWSLPMLENPADLAAPDGTASSETTTAVDTMAPDDTLVAD